jgi:hypothetical protein
MNWLFNEAYRHEQDQVDEIMRSFNVVKQTQTARKDSPPKEEEPPQKVEPARNLYPAQHKKPRQGKKKVVAQRSDQVSLLWQAINHGDI